MVSLAWQFKYDDSHKLIKESYIIGGKVNCERIYEYDSYGNLTICRTNIQDCGLDFDRYKISYNSKNQQISKKYWSGIGENWAFEYEYNKAGELTKRIEKHRHPKKKEVESVDQNSPPTPPLYTDETLEKHFTNEEEVNYIYDLKGRLIRIVKKQIRLDYHTVYIIEYEN